MEQSNAKKGSCVIEGSLSPSEEKQQKKLQNSSIKKVLMFLN